MRGLNQKESSLSCLNLSPWRMCWDAVAARGNELLDYTRKGNNLPKDFSVPLFPLFHSDVEQ
jgi:hypothetical protein